MSGRMAFRVIGRIDQRFALGDGGGGDVHVHDVGAEAFTRKFEGRLRAGGRFEEQVDERAVGEHGALGSPALRAVGGLVGDVEKEIDLRRR